jgi:predicted DNA-binding transcriptional regulator AlpA
MESKQSPQAPVYLRLADMRTRYSVSGSTIWNWCKTNGLPAPLKLGANTTVWKLADLLEWEANRTPAK